MQVKRFFALLILSAFASSFLTEARSYKRGVGESTFQYKAQIEAIAQGVTWYYNWGPTVGRYLSDMTEMEFVPMCWNGNFDSAKIRDYVTSHPGTKYILGFNEPNFTNQSNMTPRQAAEKWPEVQALAKELNLKLVAPAMNYSPNEPYQDPTKWFDEFVALVGEDAFDFLAIHCYGGFGVLKQLATTFHDRYHKPVWVTEFCYWPNEGNPNSYVAPDAQISSMIQSVEWLEKTDWIYRYAWFMATGDSSSSKGPNYGLLLPGKGEDPRALSNQGLVYTNMTDFDPEVFNQPNEFIPVQNFINQNGIVMGSNADSSVSFPLEITRFNAGASLDYQFELSGESATALIIRAGGFGEPVRFDPCLNILLLNEDGSEGTVLASEFMVQNLPNDDSSFVDISIPLNITPGKYTIRIQDAHPASPSGIIISAIKLLTPSGLSDAFGDEKLNYNVYTPAGVLVRKASDEYTSLSDLPKGLYIINRKKIIIK